MGYARRCFPRPEFTYNDVGKNLDQRGYCWKLCPWSTAYRERFRYEGLLLVNGSYQDGVWVVGNSTDESFRLDYDSYVCSEHTTTSGRMEYFQNPPGWICRDPNCHYFTTMGGENYREI
jgi:hypothetical protein